MQAPIRIGLFLPPLRLVAGIARYVSGLVHGLVEIDPLPFEFVIFHNRDDTTYSLPELPSSWRLVHTPIASASTARRLVLEQLALGELLRHHRVDLYHGLNHVVPLRSPCPSVVTYHDLSFRRMPEVHTLSKRLYWGACLRVARRRASRFIADSVATADDLVHLAGIDAARIVVAPLGHTPAPESADDQETLSRLGLEPHGYLLFVGTLEPRKNITRLVQAFAELRRRRLPEALRLKLVIVGRKGWYCDTLLATIDRLGVLAEDVVVTGFIADGGVRQLMRNAAVFVYPSQFEGFGLPVLEALACGVPTVTSDVSSMPEVAGDAALLVDPGDAGQIADAVARLLTDADLAARLRKLGPERARQFSWRRTAELTVGAYRAAIGDG